MGNEGFCKKDTRDIRGSMIIGMVDEIPVVRGSFNFHNPETFKKIEKAAVVFCQQHNLDSQYIPTVARIIAYRHDNLFEAYRRLPEQQRQQFMDEMIYLEIQLMDSLYYNFVVHKRQSMVIQQIPSRVPFLDVEAYPPEKTQQCILKGRSLLAENRVGLVLMCAGGSSRFFGQDKFLCPLDIPDKKCILQLMLERAVQNIKSSTNKYLSIPLIICCNANNRNIIQNFLIKHQYFGFNMDKVRFVQIFNLPILSQEGKFCLSFQYKVLTRPAGTGKCVEETLSDNLYGFLRSQNATYLHFCGAQNAQQNPLDPFFVGVADNERRDMCAKCVSPSFQSQNFNRYVLSQKSIHLMDTDSLSSYNKFKLMVDSPIAMNSMICNVAMMKEVVKDFNNNMFLSKQYRVTECQADYFDFLNDRPMVKQPCYMFEKDIGDILTVCQRPLLIKVSRNEFAPLISKQEEYSIKSVCRKISETENNKRESTTSQRR